MRTRRTRKNGFSLIELVIVVVIIGIIGAIAIPRISRGSEGANDAKLTGDLAVLRNAVDLFATEHGGKFPSETSATFILQMTQYSDASGATSATKTGNYIYGPYVRKLPKLSVGTNKGKDAILGASGGTLGAANSGWFYSNTTGEIKANLAAGEADASGIDYNTY